MNIQFLDLQKNVHQIKKEVLIEMDTILDNCDFIQGKKVEEFEQNFANYIGIKHFIGVGNGTDALEIAVKTLGLAEEDEIIVQGNTYIATCLGVINNNIKVVLCDIVPESHMIDLRDLEKKITPNTKAIILVHLYGLMPDMDEIVNICKKNQLYLIEDCAQAHGATYKNQKAGTFGDICCFSFYPGKNLGAFGDGGGIGTNSDFYNEKIRKLANLGCKIKYHHELIGRNSRLDTLQAAILNVKLKYIEDWNLKRRKNAQIYRDHLKDNPFIQLPLVDENCVPVYHLFVIQTNYRDELQHYLAQHGITCLIHYPISIPEIQGLESLDFEKTGVENCIMNSKKILSLPMYPELEESEIKHVCGKLNSFFTERNLVKLNTIVTHNKPGILNYVNNIGFDCKRIFYIDSFEDSESDTRGYHAIMNFNEFVIVIQGSVQIEITNQKNKKISHTIEKNETFFIPKLSWVEYKILEPDTIILVLADEIYEKSICNQNFQEFLNFTPNG